ncbi:MAG TPA: endonuclease domain-containing protein [Candidatus Acidoferrales bacterium]|nr:endonuclease domain-containing protein [Candidatus Acidoferrales bacterium]
MKRNLAKPTVASDDNLRRDRARQLRRASTDTEMKLWGRLRNGQLHGVKFRRQFPIGPFFADFCAPQELLVVELDGSQHVESKERDTRRTKYLESLGYRVVRFWDSDALTGTDEVIQEISNLLKDPHPPRAPRGGLSLPGRGTIRNSPRC